MKMKGKLVISEETREAIQKDIFIETEGKKVYRRSVIYHRRAVDSIKERKDKALINVESPDESVRKKALLYLEGLCPGGRKW